MVDLFNMTLTNGTQPIPLVIKMTSEVSTAPYQFWVAIALTIIGSIFIFILLWGFIKPIVGDIVLLIKMQSFIKKTGRHLMIIKHTAQGLFGGSMIDQSTLRKVIEGLQKFKGKPFDLLLYTPGGDVFSAAYIARLLKQYPSEIRAIIPIYSMSGGTLLALACDKIFMSENACLGAVDIQLGNLFKFGSSKAWNKIVSYKKKKAEDSSISFAMMGQQYTDMIKEILNELVIDKLPIVSQRKQFVNFMTSGDIAHAYPLTSIKLREMGLDIHALSSKTTDKLIKFLASDLYEGVYVLKAKEKI